MALLEQLALCKQANTENLIHDGSHGSFVSLEVKLKTQNTADDNSSC